MVKPDSYLFMGVVKTLFIEEFVMVFSQVCVTSFSRLQSLSYFGKIDKVALSILINKFTKVQMHRSIRLGLKL